VIAAQSEADAGRFRSIGANSARTHVTGNIKFDFEVPWQIPRQGEAWRRRNAPLRPVWVAGSTHEGEEEILLDAHAALLHDLPSALLVLVPRHPQRFADVGQLLDRRGLRWVRRSAGDPVEARTAVVLGDTMGELMMFYAAADVAFVAGSLVPIGGHNLLEPAALGKPVLAGPHNFNGEDIYLKLTEAGAVHTVKDAQALAAELARLLTDGEARRKQGEPGLAVVEDNRGALDRLFALIRPVLEASGPGAAAARDPAVRY
jgi:3-deoxy-D-manno-octulosonic-acid transferase